MYAYCITLRDATFTYLLYKLLLSYTFYTLLYLYRLVTGVVVMILLVDRAYSYIMISIYIYTVYTLILYTYAYI